MSYAFIRHIDYTHVFVQNTTLLNNNKQLTPISIWIYSWSQCCNWPEVYEQSIGLLQVMQKSLEVLQLNQSQTLKTIWRHCSALRISSNFNYLKTRKENRIASAVCLLMKFSWSSFVTWPLRLQLPQIARSRDRPPIIHWLMQHAARTAARPCY